MMYINLFKESTFNSDDYYILNPDISRNGIWRIFFNIMQIGTVPEDSEDVVKDFTKDEITSIKDSISNECFFRVDNLILIEINKKKEFDNWYVIKVNDDWYYIYRCTYGESGDISEYYRCDRFDGLMKLLKDKELIK